jgi:FMN phosphatase YigB (HAD superfamily)
VIDTVISDLGNVLLRFDNGVFYRSLGAFTGRPVEEIRAVTHDNLDLLTLFERGVISPVDFFKNAGDLLGLTAGYEEFFAAYTRGVFTLDPDVLDLYRRLKARCRMVLLSNTDIIRWTHSKAAFPEILLFDAYVLSFDVGEVKPQPGIFREALRTVGASPERTVFIDDLAANVAAAIRLGMNGIVFTGAGEAETRLRALGLEF